MNRNQAFSLHTFYPFGDADGPRIMRKDNWSGRAIAFAREWMDQASARPELEGAGVYVLRGEEAAGVSIYVGESERLAGRFAEHARRSDFWTEAVACVQPGAELDKADLEYLETRLIALAKAAGQSISKNGNAGKPLRLNEDKEAAAEGVPGRDAPVLAGVGIPRV